MRVAVHFFDLTSNLRPPSTPYNQCLPQRYHRSGAYGFNGRLCVCHGAKDSSLVSPQRAGSFPLF
jgi:hypothetical protein